MTLNVNTRQLVGYAALVLVLLVGLSAVFIKWRGFRAASTPTAFETVAARSLRDFATPSSERSKVNPVANDSVAIQRGREDFLARCASCHGVDARGLTPIGSHTYPRVPDLCIAKCTFCRVISQIYGDRFPLSFRVKLGSSRGF